MTWFDRLQKASFRGIEYSVLRRDESGGRRISIQDLPRNENPVTEDMGRASWTHRIQGFIVGADYLEKAKALYEALDKPGAGRLLDPWLGEKWIHVSRWQRTERSDKGRYVEVNIFVNEAGSPRAVSAIGRDAVGEVDASAESVSATAEASTAEAIDVDGRPEFTRDPISAASRAIGDLLKPLGVFSTATDEIAAQASRVNTLISDAASLAISPTVFASAVRVAIDGVAGTFTNALDSLYAYEALFGLSFPHSGGLSEASQIADRNGDLATTLARQAAVAGASRSASRVDWVARPDAIEARDRILAELDLVSELVEDSAYLELMDLRADLVDLVPRPDRDTPYVGFTMINQPIPALVLAYREYGAIDREGEIADRNSVAHPGFMPPGVQIEVLQSG